FNQASYPMVLVQLAATDVPPCVVGFGCILFVGTSYQSHGFGTHHWNLNLWWGPQRNGSSGLPRLNLTESQNQHFDANIFP
ncbi:hypothetical protein MUK42_03170, partial [Musa troglodytarum]